MDTYFEGKWRLDIGFGNPNKTAMLFTLLIIASWIFAFFFKSGFRFSLLLSLIFGFGLLHTYSRGGMAALAGGLGIIAISSRPRCEQSKIAALLAVLLMLGFYSWYISAFDRFTTAFVTEDRSILNRWEIWKKFPAMLIDAPQGWGIGNAGNAYMQWYQPIGRIEEYRSLVSSHLTWMAEINWSLRFAYVIAWVLILLVCWPTAQSRWFAVPLGLWTSFALGSVFSGVAHSMYLWIIPVVFLIPVLKIRFSQKEKPSGSAFCTIIGSVLIGFALWVIMNEPRTIQINGTSGRVAIANTKPSNATTSIQIIAPDEEIVGTRYGHQIRKALLSKDHPNAGAICFRGISNSERIASAEGVDLVLAGNTEEPLKGLFNSKLKRVILINPESISNESLARVLAADRVQVVWGEFSNRPSRLYWEKVAAANLNVSFRLIKGAGNYIPNWMEEVMDSIQHESEVR